MVGRGHEGRDYDALVAIYGVGNGAQSLAALFTAAISSSMVTVPSRLRSADGHADSGANPLATLTARINSSIETVAPPSQSPVQEI